MKLTLRALTGASLAVLASAAHAHTGQGHEFTLMAGASHPLFGLDHLLAMLAVGLWAAQQGGRARFWVPAAFVFSMMAGSVLGYAGIAMPAVETGIALSVLVFGLLTARCARLPLAAGMVVTAAFALLHGHAHGMEAPANSEFWLYGLGFVASTALLHGLGYVVGSQLNARAQMWLRIGGGVIASAGLWMLAA